MDLFADDDNSKNSRQKSAENLQHMPLAARLRPQTIEEYAGQEHLLASGKPLWEALQNDQLFSMVLWGPPGTGKTTLAKLLAARSDSHLETLSAVLAGVKDIRQAVEAAKVRQSSGRSTILFVDEVHRFNKAQQDAFLPFVEDGTITFIGATTENPSFELNNALLSRAKVLVLKSLDNNALTKIIERALSDEERGLGGSILTFPAPLKERLIESADGDARRLLNLLELVVGIAQADTDNPGLISEATLAAALTQSLRRFDKGGDAFYDQISALHKSVRGSNPDGALYWFCRMLDGGCDPLYLARRLVRMASEDIGNADPRALSLAMSAWETQERLGSPEGELALAQAVIYLASAAKSNAVYVAYKQASREVAEEPSYTVPMHLRNAPTQLMKDLEFGKAYRYDHDEPSGHAAGQSYFPDEKPPASYYRPVDRGLEKKIAEKLQWLEKRNRAHRSQQDD